MTLCECAGWRPGRG